MRKPLIHERLHPHHLSIICLFSHMLFMLCVVYPFVNCFCLPIWASHVHSLVVYTLYIYLSVVSIFFFFFGVSHVYLLACLSLVCSCSMDSHTCYLVFHAYLPLFLYPPIHATCTSLIIIVLVFSMPFPICLVHVHAFTCCFMHTYVHFSYMLVLVCHDPFPVLLVYVRAFTCCFTHTSICLFVIHLFIIFDREYF